MRLAAEFEAPLKAGWAKFSSLLPLLAKKDASEARRLRLFDSTVSKSVLWCAETWKLTVKQKRKLRSTQRHMLRRMVGPKRRPDEDYVSWIKRATKVAETKARKANVLCWVEAFLKAKWRWAGKIGIMPTDRWARRVTTWRDNAWWNTQSKGIVSCPIRSRPGRFVRWEDDLVAFAAEKNWESWFKAAADPEVWGAHEKEYVMHVKH